MTTHRERPTPVWLVLTGGGAILLLLVPVLTSFWMSFSPDSYITPPLARWSIRWYERLASDSRWLRAIAASVAIAAAAAAISLLLATPAALALRGLKRSRRRPLSLFLLLPALLPPTSIGCGLLPLFQRIGLWGTYSGIALAHAALAMPIVLLIVQSATGETLARLEATAAGLGASRSQVFWRVTCPLLRPTLTAAAIVVFVLSLNESLVSLFLATPDNETLPALIWPQLRYSPTPLVAVACSLIALVSLFALPKLTRGITESDARS